MQAEGMGMRDVEERQQDDQSVHTPPNSQQIYADDVLRDKPRSLWFIEFSMVLRMLIATLGHSICSIVAQVNGVDFSAVGRAKCLWGINMSFDNAAFQACTEF